VSEEKKVTASGDPVWRHDRTKPFEQVEGDAESIRAIGEHLARFLGEPETVWHEIVSDLVHLDVHVFPPRPGRSFLVLATSGMSDRAMAVPEGSEAARHAEVLVCLPPDWPLDLKSFRDERNYWPVRMLKRIGRYPHEYDTWLGRGHTIEDGQPPAPFAPGVPFTSVLIELPVSFPEEFRTVDVNPGKRVAFYALVPLHPDELRLKLTKGLEALEDLFDAHEVGPVIDPRRPSVARRKWLRIF
jgi:hypothetical protein